MQEHATREGWRSVHVEQWSTWLTNACHAYVRLKLPERVRCAWALRRLGYNRQSPKIPFFPCHSKVETQPQSASATAVAVRREPPDPTDMSSSTSSLPDWALVDPYIFGRDGDPFPADEPTEASSTNSRGDKIRVCFQLHEPPRPSRIYLSWPDSTAEGFDRFDVVAAHRDVVLFQMAYPVPVPRREYPYDMYDYFVYDAGAGGGGAPSLHRLPSIYGTVDEFRALFEAGTFQSTHQMVGRMEGLDIAVLRRGEKDVAVAELQIFRSKEPELHVIFPSESTTSWKVKKPRYIHGPELDSEDFLWNWCADAVIPFGENLCWVDYYQGAALLCNVFDDTDSPELQYLALPARPPDLIRYHTAKSLAAMDMTLSFDEESGVLKYVLITDANGRMIDSRRYKAEYGFMAATWTLQIREGNGEMAWVAGDVVKSEDICTLEGFVLLPWPWGPFQYPHVSLSNTDIVFFVVKELEQMVGKAEYDNAWIVAIDMRN
ncbi:hypothetical protein HU200_021996 [Digitaria exilis]|uniref:DUF1618 domain-containing protein n=1 Tax=Digitaria exilis TaxID=1010633 RepID=A0A835CE14_9POAL|nr:hypothetical protein HU200_021996 [Digitaria exilis]